MISRRIQENTERHNHNLTQAVRLATYAITNIVIVKCFNTQRQEEENYAKAVKNAALNSLKLGFSNALQSGFSRFISIAMFVQGQFEYLDGGNNARSHFFNQASGMVARKCTLVEPQQARSSQP